MKVSLVWVRANDMETRVRDESQRCRLRSGVSWVTQRTPFCARWSATFEDPSLRQACCKTHLFFCPLLGSFLAQCCDTLSCGLTVDRHCRLTAVQVRVRTSHLCSSCVFVFFSLRCPPRPTCSACLPCVSGYQQLSHLASRYVTAA